MKLVTLNTVKTRDVTDALDVLDELRKQVESGEVVAFAVAAVCPDDATLMFASSVGHVSRLRQQGAIVQLLHAFTSGETAE